MVAKFWRRYVLHTKAEMLTGASASSTKTLKVCVSFQLQHAHKFTGMVPCQLEPFDLEELRVSRFGQVFCVEPSKRLAHFAFVLHVSTQKTCMNHETLNSSKSKSSTKKWNPSCKSAASSDQKMVAGDVHKGVPHASSAAAGRECGTEEAPRAAGPDPMHKCTCSCSDRASHIPGGCG